MTHDDATTNRDGEDPLDIAAARQTRLAMSGKTGVPVRQIFTQANSLGEGVQKYLRYRACHRGPGQLNAEEFLRYGLGRKGLAGIERFVGNNRQQEMHGACNDRSWFAVTKNKLLWQAIMSGTGFRIPRTLAIYDSKGRGSGAPILTNLDELSGFLRNVKNAPIFCKPMTGVYSIGALRLEDFDGESALINSHWRKSIDEIAAYFEQVSNKGYLLQSVLNPHNKMKPIAPDAICTLRIMVFLDGGDVSLFRSVLKVPGAQQVADNFWREGALLCALDKASGKITRAVTGGEKAKFAREVMQAGDINLNGWAVPGYREAVEMVIAAAKYFPGIRTQSWDVAMCEPGPTLLELNFGGDLGLLQMAHDKGALSAQYCDHLRRCGYQGAL